MDKLETRIDELEDEVRTLKADLAIARAFNQRPDIRRALDALRAREEISALFTKD